MIWERGERGSKFGLNGQRWSRGHKTWGQGHKKNLRPRTDPLEAKNTIKGSEKKNNNKVYKKNFQAIKKIIKRFSKKFFRWSLKNKVCKKFFQAIYKILTMRKIVLSSSRGQGNFRGLEVSRPKTSKCVLEGSSSVNGMLQ